MNPEVRGQLQAFNEANSRMNGLYTKWAQKHNLNYSMFIVCYIIYMEDTVTQKKISHDCEIPKQTVNNVITTLKQEAYIKLEPGNTDKREKKISFTEKGLQYATEMLRPIFKIEEQIVQKMGKERMKMLVELTCLFCDFLEEEIVNEQP